MSTDTLLAFSSAALSAALAAGAALRARRSPSRWAFVAGMIIFASERFVSGLQSESINAAELQNHQTRRLTVAALLPSIWLFFSLTYARGNAALFLKKWRWPLVGTLLLPLFIVIYFHGDLILSISQIADSTSLFFNLGGSGLALYFIFLLSSMLVLLNIERTYRAAVGTVRWRIKYMLMGIGLIFAVRLFTASQALLFRGVLSYLDGLSSAALLLAGFLILRTLFRAGHFELDVYPSPTVLRNSATIFVAGIYLVVVGVFAKVAAYFGGDSTFSLKALLVLIAIVGLTILLQSDRIKLFLQRFISRHFQRPLYDYQNVWRQFTEGTSTQVGSTEYCRAVAKLLAEIFQSLSITIWLVDERGEDLSLVASTSVTDNQANQAGPDAAEASAIIRHLRDHPNPIEIELPSDDWAAALRRCHPDEFHQGSRRICLPIVSSGELYAFIILGDRVGGEKFGIQELDLLKSIGSHIVSGLINIRLAQRLLQAREHEAFQTMATFFVHDLKNAATTLNLLLRNLPDHFDDPAFREDALRGVAKSVTHINHLISRLSQLRHEQKISPIPSDLNALITDVLTDLENQKGIQIEQQLASLPPVSLDKAQIITVLTNLILNAREAMGGSGHLRIVTHIAGAGVILAVSDTGCGMTPAFIAHSLFRPFQTTKKNGLGIGMFQSKIIIEAHGGKFSVESTLSQGTTFRIFLPLLPPTP